MWSSVVICCVSFVVLSHAKPPPNIVFILADDLGWNDVGFHGSNQIPTPNIDALAYSGVILNNYYVLPVCTPSRSALLTGKYPIHTGMQHNIIYGAEPRGLPLSEKLLPEYLRELNYSTHAVGKWHLGSYKKEYTPTSRGFDSHLGFWTGHHDYNDHTAMETNMWGFDIRRNMDVAWDLHGSYSTDAFTAEAVNIIRKHNKTNPLFIYLAHAAVHSGNPYNPLAAPDHVVAQFNITDYPRRRYAAVLTKLDDSVGKVTYELQKKGILSNSIIVFSTDNGGPAAGFNLNAASNWPLRGVKNTLWEGGVRGAGFIWSGLITKPGRVSEQLMHITDWLPTLLSAANYPKKLNVDGIDSWKSISEDIETKRQSVLHNIDDIWGSAALTIGDWKILQGANYKGWDQWYGPSGRDEDIPYSTKLIIKSPAGMALQAIGRPLSEQQIYSMRAAAGISCGRPKNPTPCKPTVATCLFNIRSDPCEFDNVAKQFPSILINLKLELERFNQTAIPPSNKKLDPAGDPSRWNHVWTNFGDSILNV